MSLIDRARATLGGAARPDSTPVAIPAGAPVERHPDGVATRAAWVGLALRLASPVLDHLEAGRLRARMPIEQLDGHDRSRVSPLEAVARLLAGIAPWLELGPDDTDEGAIRARLRAQVLAGLAQGLDPNGPDAFDLRHGNQPLVEAAFLGLVALRAPGLVDALDDVTRQRLVGALEATRDIRPPHNNWLLFSATVEAALARLGAWWDRLRVDLVVRTVDTWYVGDGLYADGPRFHWDYYDSFVIHPLLGAVLDAVGDEAAHWRELRDRQRVRARRYAAIQERLVAPDGSYPPVGRSIAYRCGAFHALAVAALSDDLPTGVPPAQARGALTAVIRRTLEPPGTFDDAGWLRIGLAGHQPGLGERYVSTGSLYLAAFALLPLGLSPAHPFWADAPVPWTARRVWAGDPVPIDRALRGRDDGT
jgi:hypothetical protein